MIKQIKSWSNGKQCDWMRYPLEIEHNNMYVGEVWSRKEMAAAIHKIRGKLLQQVDGIRRDQQRTK